MVVALGAGTDLQGTAVGLARQEYSNLTVLSSTWELPSPLGAPGRCGAAGGAVYRLESDPRASPPPPTRPATSSRGRRSSSSATTTWPRARRRPRSSSRRPSGPTPASWPEGGRLDRPAPARSTSGLADRQDRRLRRRSSSGGELDQEQHDAVRDVFASRTPACSCAATCSACSVGSTPRSSTGADDVDLCWRAQMAGARVIVAPAARVRHREGLEERRPDLPRRRLTLRHAIRTWRGGHPPGRPPPVGARRGAPVAVRGPGARCRFGPLGPRP